MSLIISMAAFALVASITPGPVNIVALSSGAQFGFRASQRHVAGATLGFVVLLVLKGDLDAKESGRAPSMLYGAFMQWLNPKAWLACVAGMGAFVADGEARLVWQFAAVYLVICYVSVGCWVYAGTFLRGYLSNAKGMRLFNRSMALLLVVCAGYLIRT
jgi:threonine/homoserine/homoserine lactone efflux protein